MTTSYLAPVPDLFPHALQTALYKTAPWTMKDLLTAFDYFFWRKLWKPRQTKAPLDLDASRGVWLFVDHLARLLEAQRVQFVQFADAETETLTAASPSGDEAPPVLDVPTREIATLAIRKGLPHGVTLPDGTECIAIPCYAFTLCQRPDLTRFKQPELAALIKVWQRALDYEEKDDIAESSEPEYPPLLGALIAWRSREAEPLSKFAWQRALYCAAYFGSAIAALATVDRFPALHRRAVTPRLADAPTTWTHAISRWFTRETVTERLVEQRSHGPQEWSRFLHRAYTQLGFGHPKRLHPKRLYEQLAAYQHSEALIAMTEATRQSATSMSMTAISAEWLATLRNVMGGVTQVIPDAPTVLFAASTGNDHFTIEHTLDATLTPDQEETLALVALWTAIQGEPIHDTAADDRMLFHHLRTVLETTAPIVAIPVYNWRAVAQREYPDLHGIFFGIRYPTAPTPSPATWCAWVLAAQYLLSPLAAAVEAKKAPYTPTDVEASLDHGLRSPFDPTPGKEQLCDDDWREFWWEEMERLHREQLLRDL